MVELLSTIEDYNALFDGIENAMSNVHSLARDGVSLGRSRALCDALWSVRENATDVFVASIQKMCETSNGVAVEAANSETSVLDLLREEVSRYEELVSMVREDLAEALEFAEEETIGSAYISNLLREVASINDGLCVNADALIFVPDDLKPTKK